MDEKALAQEQARLLRRAIEGAALDLHEVWLYYFSIGGNAGQLEVEAYLHQALPLSTLERDVLAHAVNELIDHRPATYAPYSYDLRHAESTGERQTAHREGQNETDGS